MYFSVTKN